VSGSAGSEECSACEEGYICRQGEGCLLSILTAELPTTSMDGFARYCCGDPDCPNDCEREQPPRGAK
jgi:hypothetical protein